MRKGSDGDAGIAIARVVLLTFDMSEGIRAQGMDAHSVVADVSAITGGATHRRWAIRLVKFFFAAIVLYWLWRHIRSLVLEWSRPSDVWTSLRMEPWALCAAGASYAVGQVLFASFWAKLLKGTAGGVPRTEVFRAFCTGTLGKYVPGKAWVVVARTGLLRNAPTGRFRIALSVLYETLAMMAAGCAVASLCLLFVRPDDRLLGISSLAGAIGLAMALHPVFFGRFVRVASIPFKESSVAGAPREWFAIFWRWGILPLAAWVFLGISFAAVARAIGVAGPTLADTVFLTGSAAFATVVGFFTVFMPSGLGVRELVVIQLLAPRFGHPRAVAASLLLRIIWTATELLLAGIFSVAANVGTLRSRKGNRSR